MVLTAGQDSYLRSVGTPELQRQAAARAGEIGATVVDGVIGAVPFGHTLAGLAGVSDSARRTASEAASGAVSAQGGGLFNWLENIWSGFMAMVVRFLGNYLGIASTNTAAGNGLLARESTPEGPVLADSVRQSVAQAAQAARPAQSTFAPPSVDAVGIAVARAVADETLSTSSVARDAWQGALNQGRRLFGYDPQRETPQAFGVRLATQAHGSIIRTYLAEHDRAELTPQQRQTLGAEALAYADRMTGMRLTEVDGRTVLRPMEGVPTGLNAYFRAQAESINSPARAINAALPITLPEPAPASRGTGTGTGTGTGPAIGPGAQLRAPADQNITSLEPVPESARMAALAEKALATPLPDQERSFSALPANPNITPGRSITT
jgi:hypothetical protein